MEMERITLGTTGLKVSPVCLGTANFGLAPTAQDAAHLQMTRFLEGGGNFIDTAHIYNDWVPGAISRSEKIIGRWLSAQDTRRRVVLCTKGGHPPMTAMHTSRLDPDSIQRDLQESLQNLRTDWIDIYLLHRDHTAVPVDEILHVLQEARNAGHIRHYGFSNWSLPRAQAAREYAIKRGWPGFEVDQIQWSLPRLNREHVLDTTLEAMTQEFYDFHVSTGMALMAYTSLAKGYLDKRLSANPRLAQLETQYGNGENDLISDIAHAYWRERGVTPTQLSLRWFFDRPFAAVPVASASSLEQLEDIMGAMRPGSPPLPQGLPMV